MGEGSGEAVVMGVAEMEETPALLLNLELMDWAAEVAGQWKNMRAATGAMVS